MLEARRFSCIFLTASGQGAVKVNHRLSQAGIRAYHAVDTREAEVLLGITRAKVLLIDIDRTFEPWLEILQKLEESHPRVPKVVLTGRGPDVRSLILSKFALDVIPKPANLGDLFGALECAYSLALEINDPERVREREARVMAAIRSLPQPRTSLAAWRFVQRGVSAMMDRVNHVWWKFGCHRTGKQHAGA
jgi:DNA-binding NtrC family response regulator